MTTQEKINLKNLSTKDKTVIIAMLVKYYDTRLDFIENGKDILKEEYSKKLTDIFNFIDNKITTLLEKHREEYVEMIDNYPTRIDGNKDEVLSAMYTAKKLKQDIINLIKSHDKTS